MPAGAGGFRSAARQQDLGRRAGRDEHVHAGCRLINTARSGVISVAWHDGGPLFPHPIELHQDNEVITGMHERLCVL